MTNKRKRAYEIIIISLVAILMSLCAYMGITAIQKSLTLNLSFQANPVIKCQIKIGDDVVFNNKTSEMLGGVSLNGNTLTFDKSLYAGQLGNNFQMTITNLTDDTAICVNFDKGNVGNASNFQDVLTEDGEADYQVSTSGQISLRFEKVVAVNLNLSAGVTLDLEKSEIIADVENEITSYYAPMDKDVKVVVTLGSSYGNPEYSVNGGSNNEISTGTYTFTLNSSNTSTDLSLNIQAERQTYTIIFNGNGATSGSMANQTAKIGQAYTLPANTYEKAEYNFVNWKDSVGNSYEDQQIVQDLANAGESITLYAQWELKRFSLTFNVVCEGVRSTTGIIVTNDTSFSLSVGSSLTFTSQYLASDVSISSLYDSGAKITPVQTAHKDTGTIYEYYEAYQLLYSGESDSVTFSQIPIGSKVYIFWVGIGSGNQWLEVTSITTTPNKTINNLAVGGQYTDNNFLMPEANVVLNTKTTWDGRHGGGSN
ncbi:MAG: InlB B-repeat-containing protein [Clostridia bacterium]|nr:InlB B-repeat-containing protein [Clostridia bacterium]